MVIRVFKQTLIAGFLVCVFALPLFSDYLVSFSSPGWVRKVVVEIQAAGRDPGTQWMLFLCALVYFVAFTLVARRMSRESRTVSEPCAHDPNRRASFPAGQSARLSRPVFTTGDWKVAGTDGQECPPYGEVQRLGIIGNPDFWLSTLLLVVALTYAWDYQKTSASMQAMVLVTAVAFGKGMQVWALWSPKRNRGCSPPEVSTVAVGDDHSHKHVRLILAILTFMLAGAALWQPEVGPMEFKYRGVARWSGPWINPNIYGLLMGTGLVLAAGLICMERMPIRRPWVILWLVAAGLCGFGLFRSYSRGAWLGTALGLIWLFRQLALSSRRRASLRSTDAGDKTFGPLGVGDRNTRRQWLQTNWRPLGIIVFSAFVILFWQFRHTEWPPARRVFSVANVNDFSWRNRVATWQGAAQMMADRPWAGFGWGKAEEVLRTGYRAQRLEETAAIQMNDYLMLGISVGVPALIFFLGCIWSAFKAMPIGGTHWLGSVCRSGALVLLLGFWFDGGLFKLPTAVLFWTLIELGRIKSAIRADDGRNDVPGATPRCPVL